MTGQNVRNVLSMFDLDASAYSADILPYGNGHINSTFIVESTPKYIVQKINTCVFPNPDGLMNNIALVSSHITSKMKATGEDASRGTLHIIKTKDGQNFAETPEGEIYRIFEFIDAISHDNAEDPSQLYRAAKTYGKFQKMLADFNADKLYEIIPFFHHTPNRMKTLEKAIAENKSGRLDKVKKEVEFALSFKDKISYIVDGIENGSVPLRVTHNDTKLNNFLFDKDTDECLCLIDLDTIMPGSLLYDFGDALRLGASSAAEDETDLDKVNFCIEPFEQFTRGLLESLGSEITPRELELLPYSEFLMTFEVGIRFLTDYLDGDVYFKTHYPEHNIDRARNQFKLAAELDSRMEELGALVKKIYSEVV
ncbi:MAG: aminoglycoside phosphotransferase family protein [Ruminococcaceae bacterium]|nr:aminoglycoside phosphotransferase family protein [Oscillospiraceae bacterium]